MKLFNWRQKETSDNAALDIKESDFVDMDDPNGETTAIKTIDYGTGYPIDAIYSYIEKDWEEQGRNDASMNSELSYMNTKVELIRQGLNRRFDLVLLKYNDNIRQIETKKKTLNSLGLLSSLESCDAVINTCNEHIKKINEMQEAFNDKNASLMSMIESYKRGFAMGVANNTTQLINKTK